LLLLRLAAFALPFATSACESAESIPEGRLGIDTGDWASRGCEGAAKTQAFVGLTEQAVIANLGDAAQAETFPLDWDHVTEFRIELLNLYPLPENAGLQIQELQWRSGDCNLAIWFAQEGTDWKAKDAVIWPDNVEF
jgi:hypothetical protein